tara:strand:- start:287 stop:1177 length:891 start_codon:yes stop_codon:yes gene_type:complete
MEISIWTYVVGVNRAALYGVMLLAAGSALFSLTMRLPPAIADAAARLGKFSALLAIAIYGLAVVFGGADMITGGPLIVFKPEVWAMGFDSSLGRSAVIGIPGMILLAWGFQIDNRLVLCGGITLGLVSFLVTGHAATAAPAWLMSAAVAMHLACAAFWLGALYPLYQATRLQSVPEAGEIMVAFSHRAAWVVASLVLSGVIISFVQVDRIDGLVSTTYGWRLLAKLGFFGFLIFLAAYNKMIVTPELATGQMQGALHMRRSIRLEYILFAFILAAAASLTITEPPRNLSVGVKVGR